jgi:hypothetical protein
MIGEMPMGDIYIMDDKTTGTLGEKWASQWRLRAQFTGYTWAAHQYGIKAKGIIIRGISIQKTQNKTIQAFEYRPTWMIERWYEEFLRQTQHAVDTFESGKWSHDGQFNNQCATYGGCSYINLCTSPEPEQWTKVDFTFHKWNPLHVVEEDE